MFHTGAKIYLSEKKFGGLGALYTLQKLHFTVPITIQLEEMGVTVLVFEL